MLLPVGRPINIKLVEADGSDVVAVAGNREKALIVALTHQSVLLYSAQPQLLISYITHSDTETSDRGHFESIVWSQDSSKICVLTSKSHVLIYNLSHGDGVCYSQSDATDPLLRRTSQELFIKNTIPKLKLQLCVIVRLASNAKCIIPVREELLLCLQDGWLHRIEWAGQVKDKLSTHISHIPFSNDQLHSKGEFLKAGVHVIDAAYSPLLNGLGAVLSNGRGALLVAPTLVEDNNMQGVWCTNLDDCVCTSVNHKYRLIAFGCKNGDVCAYHVDDTSGSLIQAFRVGPTVKDGPEDLSLLGGVGDIAWSPYGNALSVVWSKRRVCAIFSVFGAQLWCEAEGRSCEGELWKKAYSGVEWGPECFQLWLCGPGLSMINVIRSAALNNPAADQSATVCLLGSDCVYVSPPRSLEDGALAPHSAWRVVQVPSDYMSAAWPLRYCALDRVMGTLVVAGTRGIAHCNLDNVKWRLFGNETQERELIVTGGLALWKSFTVAGCFDLNKQQDDFRFYPLGKQLDNSYSSVWNVEAQLLMINISPCEDVLVTFDVLCRICLFSLRMEPGSPPTVVATRCAEVLINDLVPHPACVVSVHLTALKHDTVSEFCGAESNSDTLLVNIAGKLVVLSPQPGTSPETSKGARKHPQQLRQPLVVASYVEHVWHPPLSNTTTTENMRPHLHQALWLQCGAKGTKVWLPLFPTDADVKKSRAFISKRIMLPFELTVYPFALCSRDCLALGAESVSNEWRNEASWTVHRNTEVFLHHLLRQLLKRNLGVYALQIAATCRPLPYFAHVLELLLHQVLEEEATSSEPIPDPLLPRIVAFIQEFPEMLQTVAHCARKTELALWTHLFATAGNPKDLFEMCLSEGRLDTAASFLIVLQNMESANASKHYATQLLEASLESANWGISRDIVRFLRAIDPSDIESPPRTPLYTKQHPNNPRLALQSPTNHDADAFIFQPRVTRQRQPSVSVEQKATKNVNDKLVQCKANSAESDKKTGRPNDALDSSNNPLHVYLLGIINKHLRTLLSTGRVQDLGACAAHLDVPLVQWLKKEKAKAARIQDWPSTLERLHADFEWPLPILSRGVITSLNKKMSNMSLSTAQFQSNENSVTAPLKVITSNQSQDSGVRTLELGLKENNSTNDTRSLLVKQQQSSPSLTVLEEEARLQPPSFNEPHYRNGDSEYSTESGFTSPVSDLEFDWQSVEQLCGDSAARGPSCAEAELRFLQQMMAEAGCVEWSLLLCLILRDLVGLARAVNAASLAQSPADTMQRLKGTAIGQLDDWADGHCLGYKPLICAVEKHLEILSDNPANKLSPTIPPPPGPKSVKAESSSGVICAGDNKLSNVVSEISANDNKLNNNKSSSGQVKLAKSAWKGEMPQAQTDWTSHEDIHVDIVNANTPTEEQSQCSVM